MIKMKRFCVVCELEIVEEDIGNFQQRNREQTFLLNPYWECEKCMKDIEDECKDNIESEA